MSNPVLSLIHVQRYFGEGHARLDVFTDASMALMPGELVALVGPSGAGKSSLLHIAGLLEEPNAGEVVVAGKQMSQATEVERTATRRDEIGFVYQFHHLLPEFTAIENVVLPQMIAGKSKGEAHDRAADLLGRLGLEARVDHRPSELSGGEQQRVAIARAVANSPKILLADEPTGNLDPKTADGVYDELLKLIEHEHLTALIATHNLDLAAQMDRVIEMENGHLVSH
ncbi:MAG: ABC transporter ATP-binding protein [Hyphomicrobiales bacterium]